MSSRLGCSSIALKLLDVSFGTVIKGAAPVFVMWGLAFGIEAFSLNLLLFLVAISSGVALAAFGEGSHLMLLLNKALEKHEENLEMYRATQRPNNSHANIATFT